LPASAQVTCKSAHFDGGAMGVQRLRKTRPQERARHVSSGTIYTDTPGKVVSVALLNLGDLEASGDILANIQKAA
jgi:hypothetical protein